MNEARTRVIKVGLVNGTLRPMQKVLTDNEAKTTASERKPKETRGPESNEQTHA